VGIVGAVLLPVHLLHVVVLLGLSCSIPQHAGLAGDRGKERPQAAAATQDDAGAVGLCVEGRPYLFGRNRAPPAEPFPHGDGADCGGAWRATAEVTERLSTERAAVASVR
jgi:hypothetical protein